MSSLLLQGRVGRRVCSLLASWRFRGSGQSLLVFFLYDGCLKPLLHETHFAFLISSQSGAGTPGKQGEHPRLLFCGCGKDHDPKQAGKERVYLAFKLHHPGKPRQGFQGKAEAEAVEE